MAETKGGNTVGGLYMRLGLSLDGLQSGFIAAEKTVQQNIARLNRESNLVKIRADIEMTGLDAVKDKTRLLEVQEQSLTRQLELQRDKLALVSAAYQEAAKNKNTAATQRLETSMERERLAVARLEAELKKLSTQRISFDTAGLQDSIAKLNSRIKNIRIQAEIDTSKLKDAGSIFDAQKAHISAVTRELELQRQKYAQLQAQVMDAAKNFGDDSSVTLNIKTNALQQYQEIQRLETKLKELQSTDVNLKIRADAIKQAEQTIQDNIARINAKIDLIRVKTEVDTSKLSGATAEFDRAKAHVNALNQELTLQNQKLVEMQRLLSQSSGTKAINIAADVQRQIQAIDQLKAKIQELSNIQPPKSGLLSEYLNIKGDITGQLNNIATAFSNLRGATSSADNAIVSVLGVIDSIPSPVGKAITALAGLPVVFAGIENSIVDMMKSAAAAGDSVYVMSRGFQMSVADTGKFTTMCKTAGVEVNDLASTLKRVQQAVVRGGEDAKAEQWLKRYGESAFDANGKLKDLNEMTLTLSRALKRAQADGNGMAFILGTMRNASADAITAIEDAEGVYEQASHIVKAGLANPTLAHEVQGNLNAMGQQAAQLGASFNNALLPVVNEIVPRMTERMGHMTQLIKDNKDVILDLGKDFAQVWGAVEDTIGKVGEGLGVLAELARKNRVVNQTDKDKLIERYKGDSSVQNAKDLVEREIANGGYSDEDIAKLRTRNDLYLKEVKRADAEMKSIWDKRRKDFAEANKSILDKYKYDDSIKTAHDLLHKLTDAEKATIEATDSAFGSLYERAAVLTKELQRVRDEAQAATATVKEFNSVATDLSTAGLERQALGDDTEALESLRKARNYREEAQAILDKMNLGDYESKKQDNWRWLQQQLPRDRETSMTEYRAIMEQFNAQAAQIEQERANKIKEIYRSVGEELKLSFSERQSLIEQEAQKQIEAGEDAAEAYSQAQDKINSKFKTSLDERIAGYKRDMDEWIQAGMDRAEAEELAQQRIDKARQEYADKIQEHYQNAADIQYNATHTAFEKEMRDIEQWQEEQRKKAETAEEIAGIIAEAAAKEAAAFEKEVDRIKKANQSLEDKIFAQEHSQYEVDRRKLQQEVAELYKNGASRDMIQRYYNNALNDLNAKAAKGGDYTKSPRGGGDIQIIDFGQQRQRDIGIFTDEKAARQKVISSLTEEQRKRLEELGVLDKVVDAQTSLANSTEQAAENIQDAGNIEIIHGDEFEGGEQPTADTQSLDDLLAGVIPTSEFRDLQTQTQEVTNSEKNLTDATDGVTSAEKNLSEATNDATAAQKNFAETTEQVKTALKNFAGDAGKLRGSKPENTDTPSKMPTKSAPTDSDNKPEKVNLQLSPKDKEFLKLSDLGFDYDTAKDIFLTGASTAAAAVGTGIGALTAPEILGLSVLGALAGGVTKGTIDNRSERLNAPENLSLDTGEIANIDLSEFSTPLSSIESNVQGIRDILQGKNAVDDANAESLQDTSTETAPDLLTPLTNISETAQSILSELQNRQDEGESANAISELQSEVSTQLSEVATQMSEGASQVTEGITSPIESLAQQLDALQTQNEEQSTSTDEGTTYLENVASTVQSIWDDMQAAKETETADAENPDDTAAKLANIDTNVAAIWQKLSEETATETPTDTPQDSELSRLATIDEKVQSILTSLQDKAASQESPLGTLLEPLKQLDSPLSSIVNAITEKKIELPVDTLVKPLDTISGFVSKIADMLSNREPPKIDISPNMDIDLGGAYVFDNEMKQSLVNDITSNIVDRITEAVERATNHVSSSSYSG